jgi:hypothetical protein
MVSSTKTISMARLQESSQSAASSTSILNWYKQRII